MVRDIASQARKPLAIKIVMEPSFLAVGRAHVAMGTNNLCWSAPPPAYHASLPAVRPGAPRKALRGGISKSIL